MRHATLAGAALIAACAGAPVQAQSLADTLVQTYQTSPTLKSARAVLRQVDEAVAVERGVKRPFVTATGDADFTAAEGGDPGIEDTYSLSVTGSLLVFDSGETRANVNSALSDVASQRAVLKSTEQSVLLSAVTAYSNVFRDQEQVSVAGNNVRVLEQQVTATNDRFELGEVTLTDVALSNSRLAEAQAIEAGFQGSLAISTADYVEVVGTIPGQLRPPPPLPPLPATLEEAIAIAMREDPTLQSARFAVNAATFDVRAARSARGPSVSLSGGYTYTAQPGSDGFLGPDTNTASVGVTGSVPLISGGQLSAGVRAAEAALEQARFDLQTSARATRDGVATAWANLAVAQATIVANEEGARAAGIAFQGGQEEVQLGARTTLDVLDLEQDLRDAQFALTDSRGDELIAAYALLAAMGLLTVEHLNLGIPTYDPDIYFSEVQNAPYSTVRGSILDKLRDRYSR
ncbi:MAG: TolC family outer membrane protein [Pseudomonadota bacterium]